MTIQMGGIRGLGLAHVDTHLGGDESVLRFLGRGLRAALAPHGVEVDVPAL